jgi:quinol monooxygenase YgiN
MIFATIRIVPQPGQDERTLEVMRAVADSAKALPGCVVGKILREISPPWGLTYSETWHDQRRFEKRLTSSGFDLVLQLLEASFEPPTVCFQLVSEVRDLAWIEDLRRRSGDSRPVPIPARGGKVIDLANQRGHRTDPSHGSPKKPR